jgi:hypothetical protein
MSSIDHSKGTDTVQRVISLIESQIGRGTVMREGEFRRINGNSELAKLVEDILKAGENARIGGPSPSGLYFTPTGYYDTASSKETYPFLDEHHGPHARRFGGGVRADEVVAIEFVVNGPDRAVSYKAGVDLDEGKVSSAWTVVFPAKQKVGPWESVLSWFKSLR